MIHGNMDLVGKSTIVQEIEQIFLDDQTLEIWVKRPWMAFENIENIGGKKLTKRQFNTLRSVQAGFGGSQTHEDLLDLLFKLERLTYINCTATGANPPSKKLPWYPV